MTSSEGSKTIHAVRQGCKRVSSTPGSWKEAFNDCAGSDRRFSSANARVPEDEAEATAAQGNHTDKTRQSNHSDLKTHSSPWAYKSIGPENQAIKSKHTYSMPNLKADVYETVRHLFPSQKEKW